MQFNTYVSLYKSNKIILMFSGQFAEDGDIAKYNPHLYNLGEYNRLSPGQQRQVILSVLFRNCIYYTRNNFVVYKANIHDSKCLRLVSA